MKTQLFRLFSLVLVFVMLLNCGAQVAVANKDTLQKPPSLPFSENHTSPGPQQDQNGLWYMPPVDPISTGLISQAAPSATGGPDDFGYTWSDTEPLNWLDASSGIDRTSNAVNLGFSFKFYENTYNQIYLSQHGYATFDSFLYQSQSHLPDPRNPNNVIAPYWAPGYLINGYIRYLTGGTAPNRYFIAEWNRVAEYVSNVSQELTFEMILRENGDVIFQYQTMTYGNSAYSCPISGIEDSQGIDGLAVTGFCNKVSSNHAVRFSRPASSARVSIRSLFQGNFTRPGGKTTFLIPVRNSGELGTDTYDLLPVSFLPFSLYAANGTTLLTDTDSDGSIDTGPINQGAMTTIVAEMQTPGDVHVGDAQTATVVFRSSLNTSKTKTVTLQTAIPTSFAQVYQDSYDGTMKLYLAQPGGQQTRKPTNSNTYGNYPSVAETPDGNFIYAWSKGRCLDTNCNLYTFEIEYMLLNKFGETIRGVTKLTDNSAAAIHTYDYYPVMAVAPDGRIGFIWYRYLYAYSNNSSHTNYNIFFAILDASGIVSYGPVNLTDNSVWLGNTPDAPQFYDSKIAATGDNRFVLAWEKYNRVANCSSSDCSLNDVYFSIRNTAGATVKDITKFTDDTTGSNYESYYYPNLTALTGNRSLLTWTRSSDGNIYYAVIDSGGNIVKDKTNLEGAGSSYSDWRPDAVQLSDGKIVVAWTSWNGNYNIRFAVLDSNYNLTAGPTLLNNPAGLAGNEYVSVAADHSGNAVITWMDSDLYSNRNLYYALVNSSGSIITQPMIFRSSQTTTTYLLTNDSGYGNTSYSSIPTGVDNAVWPGNTLTGGKPGESAPIVIQYTSKGQTTATGIVLTATLGTGLTYVGDTSGVIPVVIANQVTWNLPDIGFLDKHQFTLFAGVPGGAVIGTRYPVTLTLTAHETDINASDNTANLEVMAALQIYLPITQR